MLVVMFVHVVSGLKKFKQVTKLRCSHYKNKSRTFKVETQHYKMKEIDCLKSCRYMNIIMNHQIIPFFSHFTYNVVALCLVIIIEHACKH